MRPNPVKKRWDFPIQLLAHGLVVVTQFPLKHLIDTDWLPVPVVVVVHGLLPIHVVVTHVPLLHIVFCVTD
jgi:hypothetical protein